MNRAGIGILGAGCALVAAACSSTHHTAVSQHATRKLIAVVRNGSIEVGARGGTKRRIFSSDGCCSNVVWASRDLIAFVQNFMIQTIDVRTRRARSLALANAFNISSDGRWIAWSRPGGEGPDRVGVVSTTGECLLVPRPTNKSDSLAFFHPDGRRVYFLREPFSVERGISGSGRTISLPLTSLKRSQSACFR